MKFYELNFAISILFKKKYLDVYKVLTYVKCYYKQGIVYEQFLTYAKVLL